jgi:hypothetical protein
MQRVDELRSQAFSTFVRLWFAHTPRVAADARAAAKASAEARYKKFLDHVAERFASGKRLGSALMGRRFSRSFDPPQRAQGVGWRRAGVAVRVIAPQLLA